MTRTKIKENTKKNQQLIKIISIICIIALIANLLLFAFKVYSALVMWIVIIIAAIIAFPVINILKKQ